MTVEEEIEEVKKKHAQLELKKYRDKLYEKYERLKKLEGTVEVRIQKSSKTHRWVHVVHHISYELKKDKWVRENEPKHEYIGVKTRGITIMESGGAYPGVRLESRDLKPENYDGKIHADDSNTGVDFTTHKTITVEEFNAIWQLPKLTVRNILDGLLDIKDVRWVMNGTDHDKEFKESDLIDKNDEKLIDIPYYLCASTEEAWALGKNKKVNVFLNKNVYLITPNSLKALNEWLDEERRWDSFSASACASVGERWRGSRIHEYESLVAKIRRESKAFEK